MAIASGDASVTQLESLLSMSIKELRALRSYNKRVASGLNRNTIQELRVMLPKLHHNQQRTGVQFFSNAHGRVPAFAVLFLYAPVHVE